MAPARSEVKIPFRWIFVFFLISKIGLTDTIHNSRKRGAIREGKLFCQNHAAG
jgi:hypothetical protein